MIRFLALFVALFVAALAVVSLLPNPPKIGATRSAVAAQLDRGAEAPVPQQKVRVVYPALGAPESALVRAVVPEPTSSVAAPASPAVVSAAYPQNQNATAANPTLMPANAAVPAGTQGLNLNTASIDALNGIPGAGHIGRTIASHRPYRSVEDLLAKRVIRKSVYDRIKAQVAAE